MGAFIVEKQQSHVEWHLFKSSQVEDKEETPLASGLEPTYKLLSEGKMTPKWVSECNTQMLEKRYTNRRTTFLKMMSLLHQCNHKFVIQPWDHEILYFCRDLNFFILHFFTNMFLAWEKEISAFEQVLIRSKTLKVSLCIKNIIASTLYLKEGIRNEEGSV